MVDTRHTLTQYIDWSGPSRQLSSLYLCYSYKQKTSTYQPCLSQVQKQWKCQTHAMLDICRMTCHSCHNIMHKAYIIHKRGICSVIFCCHYLFDLCINISLSIALMILHCNLNIHLNVTHMDQKQNPCKVKP